MFVKSIRFKIILWYARVLALTLALFSIVLYHNFRQRLYENTDDVLLSRAEGVADSIDTYWETEKLSMEENGAEDETPGQINNINFAKSARRWVQERSQDPNLVNIIVQILKHTYFSKKKQRNATIEFWEKNSIFSISKNRLERVFRSGFHEEI